MVNNGWDATYSTALNWMVLCHFLEAGKRGISKETQETLRKFLADESTIRELKALDYEQALKELNVRRKERQYVS